MIKLEFLWFAVSCRWNLFRHYTWKM